MIKFFNYLFIIFFGLLKIANAQVNNFKLQVGEELTYIVKYAFLNLGEVKIKVLSEYERNGESIITTKAFIDSYEGLPFVSIHQVYESDIDAFHYPKKFLGIMMDEDTTFTEYVFNRDSSVIIRKGNYSTKKIKFDSSAVLNNRYQDGLSIFYYARNGFNKNEIDTIPCFVNEKPEFTVINYFNEPDPISIDAVDYEIDCRRLEGETNFVSVYGLTGEFEGWFSNDDQSVPIVAKMHVIIGNVKLELINWKKELWSPPIYNN